MTLETVLISGAVGAAIGTAVGGFAGYQVGTTVGEYREAKHMAEVGALNTEEMKEIRGAFVGVIDAIEQAVKGAVSEEDKLKGISLDLEAKRLKDVMMHYCIPKDETVEKQKYVSVPKLRLNIPYKVDKSWSGRDTEVFRVFDAYYSAKKGDDTELKMDGPVAIVQMWDNLVNIMITCINKLKDVPGEGSEKAIEGLELGLKTLIDNAKINEIMRQRTFEFLNWNIVRSVLPQQMTQQKRDRVVEELAICEIDLFAEAKRKQRELTIDHSIEYLTSQMAEQANNRSELVLRALEISYAVTKNEKAILPMLAKGEASKDLTSTTNKKFTDTPIGVVVQRYAEKRLAIIPTEVEGNRLSRDSFNELFNKGNFDVKAKIGDNTLIRPPNAEPFDDPEMLKAVGEMLNYQNIAIALEHDLHNMLKFHGSDGMLACGELQLRQAIINSFNERATESFHALMQMDYFKTTYLPHLIQQGGSGILKPLDADTKILLGYTNQAKFSIKDNAAQHRVLGEMKDSNKNIKDGQKALGRQITFLFDVDEKTVQQPFKLKSELYYNNIAILCAHDTKVKEAIARKVGAIKPIQNANEHVHFAGVKNQLADNINRLEWVKNNFTKLSTMTAALKDGMLNFNLISLTSEITNLFNSELGAYYVGQLDTMFNFDDINNIDGIGKKIETLAEVYKRMLDYKIGLSKLHDTTTDLKVRDMILGLMNNALTPYLNKMKETHQLLVDIKEIMTQNFTLVEEKDEQLKVKEREIIREKQIRETEIAAKNIDIENEKKRSEDQLAALKLNHEKNIEAKDRELESVRVQHYKEIQSIGVQVGELDESKKQELEKVGELKEQLGRANEEFIKAKEFTANLIVKNTESHLDQINGWIKDIDSMASQNLSSEMSKNLGDLRTKMSAGINSAKTELNQSIVDFEKQYGQLGQALTNVQTRTNEVEISVNRSASIVRGLLERIDQLESEKKEDAKLGLEVNKASKKINTLKSKADEKLEKKSIFSSYQDAKVEFLFGIIHMLIKQGENAQHIAKSHSIRDQVSSAFETTNIGKKTRFFSHSSRVGGSQKEHLEGVTNEVLNKVKDEGIDSLLTLLKSKKGLEYRGCTIQIVNNTLKAKGNGASVKLQNGINLDMELVNVVAHKVGHKKENMDTTHRDTHEHKRHSRT